MVNRLKVSILVYLPEIIVLNSRFIRFILRLLADLGYIYNYCIVNFKFLKVFILINIKKNSKIRQTFIVSRPSLRNYFKCKYFKGGKLNNYTISFNFLFFSTSRGLLTDLECTTLHIGGEPMLAIN